MPRFIIPDDAYEKWDSFIASALSRAESQINAFAFLVTRLRPLKPKEVENIQAALNSSFQDLLY